MGVLRRYFPLFLLLYLLALPWTIAGEEEEYNRLKTQSEVPGEIRLSLLGISYFPSRFSLPGKLGQIQFCFLYSGRDSLSLDLQLPLEILYLGPSGEGLDIILFLGDPSFALGREFPLFSGIFFLEGSCTLPGRTLLPPRVQENLYTGGTTFPSLSLFLGFSGIRDPLATTLSIRIVQDLYISPERTINLAKSSLSLALTITEALNSRFAYSITLSDTVNYLYPQPKIPVAEIENYAHLSLTCHWFLGDHSFFAGREISFSGNGGILSRLGGYSVRLSRGRDRQ